MLSASTPIDRGIRGLSNLSMVLAVVFLGYFIVVGPTVLELNVLTQAMGDYGWRVLPMSLRTNAFEPSPFLGEWTVFFWATWIAWAPYVGSFIARISRGRTIRQFIVGVLVAPSLFTMISFGVVRRRRHRHRPRDGRGDRRRRGRGRGGGALRVPRAFSAVRARLGARVFLVPRPRSATRRPGGPVVEWIPPADILVRGDDLLVRIDLANVAADDVEVALTGAALTVSGDRHTGVAGAETFLLRERPHGAFRRTIGLPGPVRGTAVTAELAGGLVEIRVRDGARDWRGAGREVRLRDRTTDAVRLIVR